MRRTSRYALALALAVPAWTGAHGPAATQEDPVAQCLAAIEDARSRIAGAVRTMEGIEACPVREPAEDPSVPALRERVGELERRLGESADTLDRERRRADALEQDVARIARAWIGEVAGGASGCERLEIEIAGDGVVRVVGAVRDPASVSARLARVRDAAGLRIEDRLVRLDVCSRPLGVDLAVATQDDGGILRARRAELEADIVPRLPLREACAEVGEALERTGEALPANVAGFWVRFDAGGEPAVTVCERTTRGWAPASVTDQNERAMVILQ